MAKKYREYEKMGQRVKAEVIRALTNLGEDAMNYAFESSFQKTPRPNPNNNKSVAKKPNAWTHRTRSLYDSFASAVYENGVLIEDSIKYLSPEKTSERGKGREFADEYLHRIHPDRGKNTMTVIVVAAEIYTQYLETGRHRGGYKIKVVSGARDYIERNWDGYLDGIYKRWNIPKPKSRVIRGDTRNMFYEYSSPNK